MHPVDVVVVVVVFTGNPDKKTNFLPSFLLEVENRLPSR